MLWVFLIVWLGQALLFGTILTAMESAYGPFKLHAWTYFVGMFWPFIWLKEILYSTFKMLGTHVRELFK